MFDNCLEPGKIETPKCVDLVSKSAINQICFRVQLQATNLERPPNSPMSTYCG
jgi:hypothetical protein